MPQEKAESILKGGSGKQWDPRIIDAFFHCVPAILEIKANYRLHASRQTADSSTTH
jgi:response regulator RpfG family c-di-GMP phosphodiesterase